MPVLASQPSKAIDLRRRKAGGKRKNARASTRLAGIARMLWRRAVLPGVAVAALGAGAILGWHAWRHGLPDRLTARLDDAGEAVRGFLPFRLEEVTVEGRQYVPREAILRALEVNRGDLIVAVSLQALRSRLEQIDWIEHAAVERHLPGRLHIALHERVAVAIWQRAPGDFILIDRNGRTVRASQPPPGYEKLLLVGGPGAPQQIGELFLLLAHAPELARRLTAATWVGQRRWNLYLRGGIEVRLPEEDAVAALERLAELDRRQQILARDVAVIDLRLADKLILRPNAADPASEPDPRPGPQGPKPTGPEAAKPPAGRSM